MSAVSDSNLRGAGATVVGRAPIAVPRRILRLRSDNALAERFAAGDETAFDIIYERHRPAVLAVCMGILGAAHDAEDATQETFSALAQALRSHPPTELRPWLTRVARNASIDTTRRRRHRLLTIDGEIPEVPARQSSAAGELDSVLDGIRELPESQRTALLMRELGGHSYAEIASFLEIDEDAVRGLIARARVGLRTYREATELPCATARAAIESEPDGRRHDKTVRRHLRGCASCRSYRTALRDDAKALRAVFPWQAGGIAGTSLAAGGAVTAAKTAMVGVSLSQVAATCAASVCAVGAVGGVVLLDPTHRLFNPVPLSAPAKAHHARAHKPAPVHHPAKAQATTHTAAPAAVVHTSVVERPVSQPAAHVVTHAPRAVHRHTHRLAPGDSWHRHIHRILTRVTQPGHPDGPPHPGTWHAAPDQNGFAAWQGAGNGNRPPAGAEGHGWRAHSWTQAPQAQPAQPAPQAQGPGWSSDHHPGGPRAWSSRAWSAGRWTGAGQPQGQSDPGQGHGWGHPAAQGWSRPAAQGWSRPAAQGWSRPAAQGWSHPAVSYSHDTGGWSAGHGAGQQHPWNSGRGWQRHPGNGNRGWSQNW